MTHKFKDNLFPSSFTVPLLFTRVSWQKIQLACNHPLAEQGWTSNDWLMRIEKGA
jgi:hypothetical protein